MEFKSLKNIESSFRQIRMIALVFLVLCTLVAGYSIWSSYSFAQKQREKIYVLDRKQEVVCVYDRKGHYLGKLNKRGRAPDEYLYAVKEAGFDVLLTANNHCLDRRKKGLERTILMLDSLHIPHAGTYVNKGKRDEGYPLLIEKNHFRIVLLNYTYGTNGIEVTPPNVVNYIDREQIKKDILKARRMMPDVIIACMHWGIEYRSLPERSERDLADWMITQGVDHVIGSHPHVLQPMEVIQDKHTPAKHVVVYSLGNFISNMSKEDTDGGAMVKLELQRIFRITRLINCEYSLVWTSRPNLSGKKGFELYPASFLDKPIKNEEVSAMKRFLMRARILFDTYNRGIKEYFF